MSNFKARLIKIANKYPKFAKPVKYFLRRNFGGSFPASVIDVERAEWRFYLDYICEGMVVFDVGANLGECSHFFSRFVGRKGQVHAFEASQKTFEHLQATCLLGEHKNIILNYVAVADEEKTIKIHIYPQEYWGMNSIANRPLKNYGLDVLPVRVEEVQATTIDAYCQQHRIKQIDFIKIDVEGAEYQVLLGAQQMLSQRRIRCGLFEFGQTTFDMGNNPQAIETYLKQNGYKVMNLIPGNPLFPKDYNQLGQFSMHLFVPL